MKVFKKPIPLEAVQWFAIGDHPSIKPYERYDCAGHVICQFCGKRMKKHGQLHIKNECHIACPGDWIITEPNGSHSVCRSSMFNEIYEILT